ncbi:MAG TPA: metallophosphoesterase [Actinomycetota bacterium]|nr:metallophosphoesterase [Actinomycetota bacterium]
MIRLAAVGDIHCGVETREEVRVQFASVGEDADALLLAGDLTRLGTPAEATALADALSPLRGFPMAAVLGNHDFHSDRQDEVRGIVGDAGVEVLEGTSVVWEVGGTTVGVAGIKGFGGGFEGTHATAFGEPETKAFVRHTQSVATRLEACLRTLDADVRVLLLHYAPIRDTLSGEPREIFPFLGSYLFAELADAHRVDLVLHGHAHRGVERGRTPGGIPVRNVAQSVLRQGYAVYTVDPSSRPVPAAAGRRN